jgi:hypothetical protein
LFEEAGGLPGRVGFEVKADAIDGFGGEYDEVAGFKEFGGAGDASGSSGEDGVGGKR